MKKFVDLVKKIVSRIKDAFIIETEHLDQQEELKAHYKREYLKARASFGNKEVTPGQLTHKEITSHLKKNGYVALGDHEFVKARGQHFSDLALVKYGSRTFPTVVVSDDFFNLSENAQNFLIGHELSHYNVSAGFGFKPYSFDLEEEMKADYFACTSYSTVEDAMEALEEIRDYVGLDDNIDMYNARIDYLEARKQQFLEYHGGRSLKRFLEHINVGQEKMDELDELIEKHKDDEDEYGPILVPTLRLR